MNTPFSRDKSSTEGLLTDEGAVAMESAAHRKDFRVDSWQIGCWVVNPMLNRLHQLQQTDSHRAIEPRLMQLLCYLRCHPDRVATRDELVKALWPKVIVNENSLTRAVSELRKQLATDAFPGASFIETIPKKGYRLSPAMIADSSFTAVDEVTEPKPGRISSSENHSTIRSRKLLSGQGKRSDLVVPASAQIAPHAISWTSMTSAAALVLALGLWAYQLAPIITSPGELATKGTLLAGISEEMQTWGDERLGWDRVVDHGPAALWNEGSLTVSSSNTTLIDETHHSSPVLSFDNESFAFVQCDQSGFTVYVGKTSQLPVVDSTVLESSQLTSDLLSGAPSISVYHSQERIQNLSWSPLGDSLLFAQFPKVTKAALYSNKPISTVAMEGAVLMMLDLDTLEATQIQPADSNREVPESSADMMTLT